MHRTTIAIASPIERAIRRIAASERRSFKELINHLLRQALKTYRTGRKKPSEFKWIVSHAKPVPGFDPSNRSTYLDIISRPFP